MHRLLIDAAHATKGIVHGSGPFVLQTQLHDFYLSHKLNADTDVPRNMQFIYSVLH